jgi:hypothetical protein
MRGVIVRYIIAFKFISSLDSSFASLSLTEIDWVGLLLGYNFESPFISTK